MVVEVGLWNFPGAGTYTYHAACAIPKKALPLSGSCFPLSKKLCQWAMIRRERFWVLRLLI
jgi:hypothetical protein